MAEQDSAQVLAFRILAVELAQKQALAQGLKLVRSTSLKRAVLVLVLVSYLAVVPAGAPKPAHAVLIWK
jgi:hypothetical protein